VRVLIQPLTALLASVLSSAVRIEPPTCCDVLTIAEATPASARATPAVAVAIAGAKTRPSPTPMTSSEGSTCEAYAVSTPTRVSRIIAGGDR